MRLEIKGRMKTFYCIILWGFFSIFTKDMLREWEGERERKKEEGRERERGREREKEKETHQCERDTSISSPLHTTQPTGTKDTTQACASTRTRTSNLSEHWRKSHSSQALVYFVNSALYSFFTYSHKNKFYFKV